MRLTPLLFLALLAVPAHAESPGAVGQLVLAHRLMALGADARDGLSQIAAARLAAGVEMQMVERKPEVSGMAVDGPDTRPGPSETSAMAEAARMAVAAEEPLSLLLQDALQTAAVLPKTTLRASFAILPPGQTHSFEIALDGGVDTEIGVIGDGDGALALTVLSADTPLCIAPLAPASCRITLPESGFINLRIANPGPGIAGYWLLTD